MTDPSLEQSPTAIVAGINPKLIRQYADQYASGDEAGFKNLCTIFDSLRRGELQARYLSQAYLNQISRMQLSGATTEPRRITSDTRERESSGERQTQTSNEAKPKLAKSEPKTPSKGREKITLDLDF